MHPAKRYGLHAAGNGHRFVAVLADAPEGDDRGLPWHAACCVRDSISEALYLKHIVVAAVVSRSMPTTTLVDEHGSEAVGLANMPMVATASLSGRKRQRDAGDARSSWRSLKTQPVERRPSLTPPPVEHAVVVELLLPFPQRLVDVCRYFLDASATAPTAAAASLIRTVMGALRSGLMEAMMHERERPLAWLEEVAKPGDLRTDC
ncbi:hypothetical protein HU200_045136 [Digitaria exilis]|uniref:Uncharacterized protein n=1 Tax=Digitaria exilis TaxID=1010633 RepID=A0A835AZY1_9POAL|nr:hypothetical protein HU200_045136 [Digitaria exilis]